MTKFEKYIITTLILDFKKGLALRKDYTKAFDKAFKIAFGESFGLELEINVNYLTVSQSGIFASESGSTKKLRKLIHDMNNLKTPNKKHCAEFGTDGPCYELRYPVYPQNLYKLDRALKTIQKNSRFEIGSSQDTSSSIHLHFKLPGMFHNSIINANRLYARGCHVKRREDILSPTESFTCLDMFTMKDVIDKITSISRDSRLVPKIDGAIRQLSHSTSRHSSTVFTGLVRFNNGHKTLEWRLFPGANNIGRILYFALIASSINRAIYTKDLEVFELLIDITLDERTFVL